MHDQRPPDAALRLATQPRGKPRPGTRDPGPRTAADSVDRARRPDLAVRLSDLHGPGRLAAGDRSATESSKPPRGCLRSGWPYRDPRSSSCTWTGCRLSGSGLKTSSPKTSLRIDPLAAAVQSPGRAGPRARKIMGLALPAGRRREDVLSAARCVRPMANVTASSPSVARASADPEPPDAHTRASKCFEKICLVDLPKLGEAIDWNAVRDDIARALSEPVRFVDGNPPNEG
jgi:hypothetical protein